MLVRNISYMIKKLRKNTYKLKIKFLLFNYIIVGISIEIVPSIERVSEQSKLTYFDYRKVLFFGVFPYLCYVFGNYIMFSEKNSKIP